MLQGKKIYSSGHGTVSAFKIFISGIIKQEPNFFKKSNHAKIYVVNFD